MKPCKKSTSGKHIFMPESIIDQENGWRVDFTRCLACGLVDDEKGVKKVDLMSRFKYGPKNG